MPKYPHLRDKDHNIRASYFEVEYEEVFHLKELYKLVFEWTELWQYGSIDGIGEIESLYWERVNQNGSQEHHIWWRFERKINSYVKYFIKFDFQTLNMSKIEVMHKGKKAKTNKGDVIMRADAWVMLDWQDQWKNHWLLKHVDEWYVKRWYKSQVEQHKKALWFELYNLEDSIKQYLTLHTQFERPEQFRPAKGLP
ncbi:hypothetical protein JXA12_06160 [Candidatus Woesearchaeota archaeon]|nr:hypothetical protein [Candidatus Woesearchaeota archaeon]